MRVTIIPPGSQPCPKSNAKLEFTLLRKLLIPSMLVLIFWDRKPSAAQSRAPVTGPGASRNLL